MKVDTNALEQCADNLESSIRLALELRDVVAQTADRLMEESIGEQFRPPILRGANDIEEAALELIQLRELLLEIAARYAECENRIVSNADDPRSTASRTGFFGLEWAANWMLERRGWGLLNITRPAVQEFRFPEREDTTS